MNYGQFAIQPTGRDEADWGWAGVETPEERVAREAAIAAEDALKARAPEAITAIEAVTAGQVRFSASHNGSTELSVAAVLPDGFRMTVVPCMGIDEAGEFAGWAHDAVCAGIRATFGRAGVFGDEAEAATKAACEQLGVTYAPFAFPADED